MAQTTTPQTRRSKKDDRIQTIKLEPYDDVISIRDRLQFVEMRRILLILPPQGQQLRRKLDLLMIQREAARRRVQIALLTEDPAIAEHAHELNISVFTTTRQARSRHWKSGSTQVFVDRSRPQSPYAYELMSVASRIRPKLTPAQKRRRLLGQVLVGIVMFVAVAGALTAIVPSATVTLTPASDGISESVILTVDPTVTEIDILGGLIPATVHTLVIPGAPVTVEASGRRDADDSLAQGVVLFTNETNTAVFVPAGTIVSTRRFPAERYRTLENAALPADLGATAEVQVVALEDTAGLNGNVEADLVTRVEGALETQVSVRNPDPMFGGGIVQEGVVTDADRERLLTLGRQAVLQAARNQLLLQLPAEDKLLLPDTIELVEERPEWTIFSVEVGESAESVTLNMRGLVQAIVVDQIQLRQLALILLSRKKAADREINETSLHYDYEIQGVDDQGRVQIRVEVQGNTYYAINAEAVANRINGMSIDGARNTLENELLLDPRQPPEISVFPFSIGRMPFLPVRINVVVRRP